MLLQRSFLLLFVLPLGLLAQYPAVNMAAVAAQEPPPAGTPTGSIEGRVTNSQSGDGVSGATVRLAPMRMPASAGARQDVTTTTGLDGSFHFDSVAPGTYFAIVEGKGFVASSSRAALRPVSVGAGQHVSDIAITLMPQATISGKVVDDDGNTQEGARVQAFSERLVRGKNQLYRVSQATTDKTGAYNLANLSPGKYYLTAEAPSQPLPKSETKKEPKTAPPTDAPQHMELVRTYYPRALNFEDAGTLDVQSGQDLSGTVIQLRRVITHHLGGKVDGLAGAGSKSDVLLLAPKNGIQSAGFGRRGNLGADGRFEFDGVVPGDYTLRLIGADTTPGQPGHPRSRRHLLAQQDVEVGGGDVEGIDLAVLPPITVSGHVTADGLEKPDFSQMRITLAPIADDLSFGSYQNARVTADGIFSLENLSPVKYVVHAVGGPTGTYVKTLTFNGQDLLTQPMDLSLGAGGELNVGLHSGLAELDGTVQTSNQPSQIPLAGPAGTQAASPFPMVVLIPDKLAPDGTGWLVAPVQPSGSFTMRNLHPGHYTAFAVERFDGTIWQNPAFLKEIASQGIGIDLAEHDHKQVQISTISNADIQQVLARTAMQ